jgi:hypothetical protein
MLLQYILPALLMGAAPDMGGAPQSEGAPDMWGGRTASAEAAAMVLEASQRVQVRRLVDRDRIGAATGLRLAAGDSVFVPRGASVTLLLRTGRVQQIGSDYVIPGGLQAAGRTVGHMAVDASPGQRSTAGYFRPAPGTAVAIEPRNDVLLLPGVVTFQWHGVAEATDYTVHVRRLDVPGHVRFRIGADTTWTPEPGALESGVAYEWQVLTDGGTRAGPPAVFRVISEDARAAVQRQLDEVADMPLAERGRLLLRALVYRDAGLLYEARRAFELLAAADEVLSDDMRAIHADVLDALGDAAGAARILETLPSHHPE